MNNFIFRWLKYIKKWSLNRNKRPHHAIEGAEWFLREDMNIYIGSLHPGILAYAILTHHLPLYVPREIEKRIDDAEKEKLRHFNKYSKCRALIGLGPNSINNLIRGTKKHVRFDLADVIGIVKLADIISAKNIPLNDVLMQYYWPENLEEKLISGISKRAYEKRGNFDSFKFEKQMKIASSTERNLLIAAPTGWGKTTLVLIRIIKLKPIKVFYILPTITAIKDFYDTFTKI